MAALDTAAAAMDEPAPDTLVPVGTYPNYGAGFEYGLVILAMEHPYWLQPRDGSVELLVEPQIAAAARHQLLCFDRERLGWPPKPPLDETPAPEGDVIAPLLWAVAMLGIFRAQLEWPELTNAGMLDPQAIFQQGEWWRLATALFLHADAGHVISNTLSGIFVLMAVTSTISRGRAWALLGLASIAGNLIAAWARIGEDYRSLGASTAIFAGLGLLTGRAVRQAARHHHPHRWRAILVPLAAGFTLLGLYGAGGLRVDVGAHVAGFFAGSVLGFIAGVSGSIQRSVPTPPA